MRCYLKGSLPDEAVEQSVTVACDLIRVGAVLPTTRSPSTKQTRIRAALDGSTPSANWPAAVARDSASATLASMALKKPAMRRSTSASRPAISMAVATSRHPRRPLAALVRSILIGFGVVGVADIHAHGQSQQLATEMILQARRG